jgi:hypothetical protein
VVFSVSRIGLAMVKVRFKLFAMSVKCLATGHLLLMFMLKSPFNKTCLPLVINSSSMSCSHENNSSSSLLGDL